MNVQEQEEQDFGRDGGLWDADPDVCCAAFQTGACAHTEDFDYEDEAPIPVEDTRTYDASFKLVRDAKAFEDRLLANPGSWYATNIRRVSTVVSWEGPRTTEYLQDMLETVGYYGSAPTGRKAQLNGITAPASY